MTSSKRYPHLPSTDYIGAKPGPQRDLFSELDAETMIRNAVNTLGFEADAILSSAVAAAETAGNETVEVSVDHLKSLLISRGQ